MESKPDTNILNDISKIIISMSLNIDHYNKANKDIIENPAVSDFFEYFSKTKVIWIQTVKNVLKNTEIDTTTLSINDKQDIADIIVNDMLSYMYVNNIQYEFEKEHKNVTTLNARKYVEELFTKEVADNLVEVEIGQKIYATLLTKSGFRQIITDIENDKAYTVIGLKSSLYAAKFGGKKSRKSKKSKKSRKSRKTKKY
jgi:hypothetical protein